MGVRAGGRGGNRPFPRVGQNEVKNLGKTAENLGKKVKKIFLKYMTEKKQKKLFSVFIAKLLNWAKKILLHFFQKYG